MQKSEADTRAKSVDPLLASAGWDMNLVTRERGREEFERGVKADYFLYLEGVRGSVAVIEAKPEGTPIEAAVTQAMGYVRRLREQGGRTAIAFVSDGKATRALWHTGEPLRINGEDVRDVQPPRVLRQFVENDSPNLTRGEIPRNSQALVDLFKRASRVLHKEGIENLDALVEFSNLLFVKILTELHDDGVRDEPPVRWGDFSWKSGRALLEAYNAAIDAMSAKYEGTFTTSQIKSPSTVEKLVQMVDRWSFADAGTDIKGEAYEYFLREYNKGKSALGQHFTARHVVKAMVDLLNPVYGETIYDPFCGTGGMLIQALKSLTHYGNGLDKTLREETFYGGEISRAAQTAKMNLILAGDGSSGILRMDSLAERPLSVRALIPDAHDVVISNVPFAVGPEIAYIKHCMDSVKKSGKNGRLAVIIPERFLDSMQPGYVDLRKELVEEWTIRRIVSLPREVFRGITSAKTSFIYALRVAGGARRAGIPYFKVDNDGYTKDSRRMPLPGRNDLDRLVETRDDDSACEVVHPAESNGYLLRPEDRPISVVTDGRTAPLGDITNEALRPVTVHDDMTVREPGFKKDGPLRVLYAREEKHGYNTRGKSRRLIKPGDLVVSRLHTQDGMFAVADQEYHATGTFMALEVDESQANPHYVALALLSIANQMSMVDTTGREQYSKADILNLPVTLPPLEEQNAIATQWRDVVRKYLDSKAAVADMIASGGQS